MIRSAGAPRAPAALRAPLAPLAPLAVLAALAALAAACAARPVYRCQTSDQCVLDGVAGACETTGYCSFPDPTCLMSRRYHESAGEGLAGACVFGALPPDAPIPPPDAVDADPSNTPPACTLDTPGDGDAFAVPATVVLAATCADEDGTIVRVDFYDGATVIGSAASSPYAHSWTDAPAGHHTVRAVGVDDRGGTGATADAHILVGDGVLSFTLIDADLDQPIAGQDPIAEGSVLDLSDAPTVNLNVRANTFPATVGSVVFGLDGISPFTMDDAPPYAAFGDVAGDYSPFPPTEGPHSLTATPFSNGGGHGTAGAPLTLNFTVVP